MPVSVNITKAKVMTQDKLRAERKPLLEEQDVLFMQAQEASASTTAIVTEKNRLRNITGDYVSNMSTIAELEVATAAGRVEDETGSGLLLNGTDNLSSNSDGNILLEYGTR